MLKQRPFSDRPSNPKFLRTADENQSGVLYQLLSPSLAIVWQSMCLGITCGNDISRRQYL